MTDFTPLPALLGGLMIGLAASGMLLTLGRIAGVSGMLGRLLYGKASERGFRLAFIAGLASAGLLGAVVGVARGFPTGPVMPLGLAAIAGMLVGVGTSLANGCTSGHGVCGNARLSKRSIVATVTFIGTGALTVGILRATGAGF